MNDIDTLPFGAEIDYLTTADPSYKFAGMERDDENSANLDYALARYYNSRLGRFLTPDWAATPVTVPYAVFGDPQTLNLYTYVENAPLNKADADGHTPPFLGMEALGPTADNCPNDESCIATDLSNKANIQSSQQAQNKPKPKPAKKPASKPRPVVQQVREINKVVVPGKRAGREVDYYPVDPNTKGIEYSGHTLTLSEKLVGPAPPVSPGICNPPCSAKNEFEDDQSVYVRNPFSVERRWSVDGQAAGVLSPDGKVYDYEVNHNSVEPGVKEPFQTEYKNDPNQ